MWLRSEKAKSPPPRSQKLHPREPIKRDVTILAQLEGRRGTYDDGGPAVNALSLRELEVDSSAIVPECDYQTLT